MKTLLAAATTLALACCSMAPVPAAEVTPNPDGTATIVLNKEEAAACKKEGGCHTITLEVLREVVKQSIQNACGKDVKWQPISKKPLL